jgi:hypothetical protein
MPLFLSSQDPDFEPRFQALLGLKREEAEDVDQAVAAIIADVRARGDAAVIELTAKFDRTTLTAETMAFSPNEIAQECAKVSAADRSALELAAERIRAYHSRQMPQDAQWTDGVGGRTRLALDARVGSGALCAGGAGVLSILGLDERRSRQSGWRAASGCRLSHTERRGEPLGLAGRPDCGR